MGSTQAYCRSEQIPRSSRWPASCELRAEARHEHTHCASAQWEKCTSFNHAVCDANFYWMIAQFCYIFSAIVSRHIRLYLNSKPAYQANRLYMYAGCAFAPHQNSSSPLHIDHAWEPMAYLVKDKYKWSAVRSRVALSISRWNHLQPYPHHGHPNYFTGAVHP